MVSKWAFCNINVLVHAGDMQTCTAEALRQRELGVLAYAEKKVDRSSGGWYLMQLPAWPDNATSATDREANERRRLRAEEAQNNSPPKRRQVNNNCREARVGRVK